MTKVSTLANLLPCQAFIQAVFLRFKSTSVLMVTIDHAPEVWFQIPILEMLVAILYFLCPQIYFIQFLGNEEQNLDSISCYFQCLFSRTYE